MQNPSIANNVTGFLFCAGLGTRLRPLTNSIPKPLVPYKGKPLLEYNLNFFAQVGITHGIISTHYLKEQFRKYAGLYKGKVWVDICEEKKLLGHAGSLRNALKLIHTPWILAINGDTMVNFDINALAKEINKEHDRGNSMHLVLMNSEKNPLRISPENALVGIRNRTFVNQTPSKSSDAAGIYLIPTSMVNNLISKKDGFMGFYGEDDLVERIYNNGGEVKTLSLPNLKRKEITRLSDLSNW